MATKKTTKPRKAGTKPKTTRVVTSRPRKSHGATIPIMHEFEIGFKPVLRDVTGLKQFKKTNERYETEKRASDKKQAEYNAARARAIREEHESLLKARAHRRNLAERGHVHQGMRRSSAAIPKGTGSRTSLDDRSRGRLSAEEKRRNDRERKQRARAEKAANKVRADFKEEEEREERAVIINKLRKTHSALDYDTAWKIAYKIQNGEMTFNQAIRSLDD